jgi:hypothetical protein
MTLYILVVKLCREVLVFYSRYLQSIFVGVGWGGVEVGGRIKRVDFVVLCETIFYIHIGLHPASIISCLYSGE